MTDEKVSVLIVENHAIYRRGLCAQFAVDPAIEVLAECDTAAEAVRKALELRPSVVLMDLHLPWAVGMHPTYCGARAILQILQEERRSRSERDSISIPVKGRDDRGARSRT